jgi:hypothetical protein
LIAGIPPMIRVINSAPSARVPVMLMVEYRWLWQTKYTSAGSASGAKIV